MTIRKLTVVLPLIVFSMIVSSTTFSSSDKVESRVHAQGSGGGDSSTCDDIDPCKIWGLTSSGQQIVQIDVCNKTVVLSSFAPGGQTFSVIAAAHGENSLRLGQSSGAVVNYPISFFRIGLLA